MFARRAKVGEQAVKFNLRFKSHVNLRNTTRGIIARNVPLFEQGFVMRNLAAGKAPVAGV
jgi:hypothetical protein